MGFLRKNLAITTGKRYPAPNRKTGDPDPMMKILKTASLDVRGGQGRKKSAFTKELISNFLRLMPEQSLVLDVPKGREPSNFRRNVREILDSHVGAGTPEWPGRIRVVVTRSKTQVAVICSEEVAS